MRDFSKRRLQPLGHLTQLGCLAHGGLVWVEQAYPRLLHYNLPPKGGHFAAWEQPALLTEEMRVGFRSLRD